MKVGYRIEAQCQKSKTQKQNKKAKRKPKSMFVLSSPINPTAPKPSCKKPLNKKLNLSSALSQDNQNGFLFNAPQGLLFRTSSRGPNCWVSESLPRRNLHRSHRRKGQTRPSALPEKLCPISALLHSLCCETGRCEPYSDPGIGDRLRRGRS